jgi:hypothetical protein
MKLVAIILFICCCCCLPLEEVWSKTVLIQLGPDGSLIIQDKVLPLPQKPRPLAHTHDYNLVTSKGKMYIIQTSGQRCSEMAPVILSTRRNPTTKSNSAPPPPAQTSDMLSEIVKKHASQHGIDSRLVQLVIKHESGFNPQAVSPKGARGLMQLMPGTATMLGVSDPFDPDQNIAGGVKYLKHCLERFNNDVALALAAYNAGPENVSRHRGVPPFAETRNYVASIMGDYTGQTPTFQQASLEAPAPATSLPPAAAADGKKLGRPSHPLVCLPPLYISGPGQVSLAQVGKIKIITITGN